MKHFSFYLILSALLYSCSGNNVKDREFIQLSTDATDYMIFEVRSHNNKLIEQLNSKYPVLDTVKETRNKIIELLHSRIEHLIKVTGGLTEYGELVNPYEENTVEEYLLNKKEAEIMRDSILFMVEELDKLELNIWVTLKDAKDIAVFANDSHQSTKGFAELNFRNRKLYQVVNTFAQIELGFLIEEQAFLAEFLMKENDK